MSKDLFKLALFGHPVKHSLSPIIHQDFAEQCGLQVEYTLINVDSNDFANAIKEFFKTGGHGANVTLPHKALALDNVDLVSKRAHCAKAINTLHINQSGQIVGDNTDGIGFIKDLSERCDFNCQHKKILILGAGGATQGIVPALMEKKPLQLLIANRSIDKALDIVEHSGGEAIALSDLPQLDQRFDLIIHASSLGHDGKCLQFFPQHMHDNTMFYDLSYGTAADAFADYVNSLHGQNFYDGIGMLVEQAAYAFEMWFGVKVKTTDITRQLTKMI